MVKNKNKINLDNVYSVSFEKTTDALQLLSYTVLYYNFNYNKDKLLKFNKEIRAINEKIDDKEYYNNLRNNIINKIGYDCEELSNQFPSRIKMSIVNTKQYKDVTAIKLALTASSNAMKIYLVLAIHVMLEIYNFKKSEIELWWSNVLRNAENYSNGMTSNFIVDYFKDQIDLTINL